MKEYRTRRPRETRSVAGRIARGLAGCISRGELESVAIGLVGQLGAGKTEFVRGFMAGLDPERARFVCSPTYSIAQTYAGDPEVRHIDLYRLAGPEELEAIGYRELCLAPGIALVEWIDNVPGAIPDEWIEIALAVRPTDVREILIRLHGDRLVRTINQICP